MRFLLPDQLGNDKHFMMFHSTGFAIAAGVVAVGAAAASSAISMSAADRAKKAQGAAAAQFKKQQRKAVKGFEKGQAEVQGMIGDVKAPEYNLGAMIGDAGQISDYNRQQLEQFLPGAAAQREKQLQLTNQAMDILAERLRGQYGEDVTQGVMRDVAQFAGAGFNIATAGKTGGFQAAQGFGAAQLGQKRLDVQNQAFQLMPSVSNIAASWQDLARGFAANPLDVGRLQLGYQTAQAEVGLQKAKMTSDIYGNMFNAQSGLATQIYGANKENAAASYAAQQAVGQGVSDIGKATSGALSGYGAALAGMNGGGGFSSSAAAQQAAPYAGSISQVQGMGYVPKASAAGFGNFDYGS
jgi:hypothetical protein